MGILTLTAPHAPDAAMADFWIVLVLCGAFLALVMFIAWLDLKDQAADLAAGRPRRPSPTTLM